MPDLKVGVFHLVYESKLAGAIDTWIVQPPGVGSLLEKGCKEFWIYNDPRLGSFICPASDIRALYWMACHHGMGGFLVWNTVSWTEIVDGRILSPHYIMYHPADTRTGDPYASLRMTLVRDGVEDYDYLKLFEKRLAQARTKGRPGLAEAEAVWAAVRRGMPKVNTESETEFPFDSLADLLALRDRIAEQIEKLSD